MYEALLVDLDGVVTRTAAVHAAAWKRLFDEFLGRHAERTAVGFEPFDIDRYRTYVDGRPRYAGVESFLASRGIELPYGTPEDSADRETICGLGNRKNLYFRQHLRENGVGVYDDAVALVRSAREQGPGSRGSGWPWSRRARTAGPCWRLRDWPACSRNG
jgi:beta-phosphoglucomutase-like phosphatase (HAD superfamily)